MAKGLLALLAPKDDKDDDDKAGADDEEIDAAQDVLDAIHDDDAEALSLALTRYFELCSEKHGEDY